MNSRTRAVAIAVLMAFVVLAGVIAAFSRHPPAETAEARNTTADLLADDAEDAGFARAETPRAFTFPRDHAAHTDFRTEWWYFTGHLADAAERAFGFQLTLFRFELDSRTRESASAWRTPRVFLGHFALTDVERGNFHAFERMSRALPGIAGIGSEPPAVWLDDWTIRFDEGTGGWTLAASHSGVTLELRLTPDSAPVAHGDRGLSQKSAAVGNASYYYSVPRLAAQGTLSLPDGERRVRGTAWLDREWSTSALDRRQAGWDWFALQLDDGASLMYYRLRSRDGEVDPRSAGTYVGRDGAARPLSADDVEVSVMSRWRSAATGIEYPATVRLVVAPLALDVTLTPRVADQEWRGRFRYWEGAATVAGRQADAAIGGLAYVELTGY